MPTYIELHARSAFSFLEGASVPEELIAAGQALELPAMALLDRDGVYGSPRFHLAAKKIGITAHIGAEITVRIDSPPHTLRDKGATTSAVGAVDNSPGRKPGVRDRNLIRALEEGDRSSFLTPRVSVAPTGAQEEILEIDPRAYARGYYLPPAVAGSSSQLFTLPLLVRNRSGYQNLCRLITLMKLRVPKHAKPGECAVTPDELAEYAEGLVCLTGDRDGPLGKALHRRDAEGAEEAQRRTEWLVDVFGKGNVYAELQRHFNREEEARNQAVLEIARHLDLPLLATNGICHATKAQREVTDVFTCIRNHVRLETAGRLLATNSERYLKPAKAMTQLFADLPEAIHNTAELSSRLQFTLTDLGYEFPKYAVPAGETMTSFLRQRTEEGARRRYTGENGKPTYELARLQLDHELRLIEKLKLEGYFLIVWDIVEFCKRQGILIQGRGSAANSAVCYSLGITAVDPVGMELLFERFLSEERGEWPDIDLDLPSGDQRERAIQYVYERYGKLGAAMTANVITYRGRSAAREVGKALDFDDETLGRLAGLVHTWEWKDPKDSTARQFRDAGLDLHNPRIKKFFELYERVQDLPRHLGQHSGGMMICQGQLNSVVPLEPAAMPGRVVVQWDKEDCADLGLIKVDLLGLGMMAVLEDSIELIRDAYKEEVDLAHLPQDDEAVYSALQKADTIGMFQVESRAQMSCLPRLRPQTFYDIVVQVAIIRPGPIVGNMVHPYLKRRQGRERVTYAHPLLEPVLRRTLGVPLFQEQLLKIAMICADFSGGEAEELRRAFGFKRSEARMKEIEVKLRRGMAGNGISQKSQEEIVQAITSFALYGFPESHAASFALIAYASAYLKCHYLAAFTAAILNNQPMGFYQPFTLVKDAQRHGLKVRPVDVTRSDWLCTIEEESPGPKVQSPKSKTKVEAEAFNERRQVRQIIAPGVSPGIAASKFFGALEKGDRGSLLEETISVAPCGAQEEILEIDSRAYARGYYLPPADAGSLNGSNEKSGFESELLSRSLSLRLGLRYVKGLSEQSGKAIVRERMKRAFVSIDDLKNRVPELRKDEMRKLAAVGALNFIQAGKGLKSQVSSLKSGTSRNVGEEAWDLRLETWDQGVHRRDALWQVERVARPAGELYEELHEADGNSPLAPMTRPERMDADFRGTGLTIGRHPVAYHRAELNKLGACRASDMQQMGDGSWISVGGWVIVRQRPGTAKGFVFLTLEDETGVANIIITPQLFDKNRSVLVDHPFLLIEGTLQNQDNVVSVKAKRIRPLSFKVASAPSHDFH
ncbi:MAG: DNA polymerase III subunit alpha [Pyrinomonadaceae bacterium]